MTTAATVEKGHGRIETRTISVSRECVAHLRWPGAAQICRIERIRERTGLAMGTAQGPTSREVSYAITSLAPEQADPKALLALWRDHWLIENRLHWRRDAVLREDHSTLRTGTIPQAIAAIRNAMLHIVRKASGPLAQTRETFAENRIQAITVAQQGFL